MKKETICHLTDDNNIDTIIDSIYDRGDTGTVQIKKNKKIVYSIDLDDFFKIHPDLEDATSDDIVEFYLGSIGIKNDEDDEKYQC